MKLSTKIFRSVMALAMLSALFLQGCVRDNCNLDYTYAKYSPVYMTASAFEGAVEMLPAQDIKNPGKIYIKDAFLFINEVGKGVHVLDNDDPTNPVALGFLRVPGNYEIQANCDKLYLDSSKDLLVFDISNPAKPVLENRVRNAMPHIVEYRGYVADASQGVVVEWVEEIVTEPYNCETGIPAIWELNQVDPNVVRTVGSISRSVNPASPGKAGSMSRFAIQDEHMYVILPQEMWVFNAAVCGQPVLTNKVPVDMWGGEAEMIFSNGEYLFVGATNGMRIFTTEFGADNPTLKGVLEHANSCDPVVTDGDYAYVTLRNGDGRRCGDNFANQLDIVDIRQPAQPRLMSTFPMTNPHGVGVDQSVLFIADGEAGLRVFDAKDPINSGNKKLAHFPDMQGFDVIPYEGTLIMIGADGVAQYDYTDPKDIKLLSTIPVTR
ncbi:MAG: hypothetical protein AAF206_01275 [Bacteroidota bacterium]